MKYLGIDYGTKRVGIALSDDEGRMAFPEDVILNTRELVQEIVELAEERGVTMFVVGKSYDLSGKPNPLMAEIDPFVASLKETSGLPVVLHTEVFTSQEAKHIQGDNDMNDASAAAIILQSYIDLHTPARADSDEDQSDIA